MTGVLLAGVMAALVTPWDPAGGDDGLGGIDGAGLERLIERISAGGADGISPGGSTGEGALLTADQRAELTRRVRDLVPAGMPVIPGLPLRTLAEGRAELAALAAAGADAALVAPPYYYPLPDAGVARLYTDLAGDSPLPLVLYNIPQFTKVRLAPATVGILAQHPNVIGIKDSSRDMEYQQEVIIATADADFAVLTGTDTLLVPSLALGAKGTIAGSVNLVPELVTGTYKSYTAGDHDRAIELQRQLAGIVAACRDGYFPAGWKAALEIAGVCARHPVPPGLPLDDQACLSLAAKLSAAGLGYAA